MRLSSPHHGGPHKATHLENKFAWIRLEIKRIGVSQEQHLYFYVAFSRDHGKIAILAACIFQATDADEVEEHRDEADPEEPDAEHTCGRAPDALIAEETQMRNS